MELFIGILVPSALRDIADRIEGKPVLQNLTGRYWPGEDKPMLRKVVAESPPIKIGEIDEFAHAGFVAVERNGACRILVSDAYGMVGWRLLCRLSAGFSAHETFTSRKRALWAVARGGATVYRFESVADLKEVLL